MNTRHGIAVTGLLRRFSKWRKGVRVVCKRVTCSLGAEWIWKAVFERKVCIVSSSWEIHVGLILIIWCQQYLMKFFQGNAVRVIIGPRSIGEIVQQWTQITTDWLCLLLSRRPLLRWHHARCVVITGRHVNADMPKKLHLQDGTIEATFCVKFWGVRRQSRTNSRDELYIQSLIIIIYWAVIRVGFGRPWQLGLIFWETKMSNG